MTRLIYLVILTTLFLQRANGQDKNETKAYFNLLTTILTTENLGNNLVYRLDTLKARFIPSRSHFSDYFTRDIDVGFQHRRIGINLNFSGFQIDLLCRKDTIFLSSIVASNFNSVRHDEYDSEVIGRFLKKRNKFYGSSKTVRQLISEISFAEEYAFYCGDGSPKTKKGKYIEQLVQEENIESLKEMLRSLSCETQAYGVAGFDMFENNGNQIPSEISWLIDHIRTRNSELIVCSGCMSGLVKKIY